MKAIILAAGQGSRLKPLTDDKPKCMVEIKGRPIIDRILDVISEAGIKNIVVINGYQKNVLEQHLTGRNIVFYTNEKYSSTNMVSTLFSAQRELAEDDIIVSYSDIIYSRAVLEKLIESDADISVVVDRDWRKLWDLRMRDPLEDAETMRLSGNGDIIELGKKPLSLTDIEGQYIGLLKFSKRVLPVIIKFYTSLDRKKIYDGKTFEQMYMTSLVQEIINDLMPVRAVCVNGGWLEIDNLSDLKVYERSIVTNILG